MEFGALVDRLKKRVTAAVADKQQNPQHVSSPADEQKKRAKAAAAPSAVREQLCDDRRDLPGGLPVHARVPATDVQKSSVVRFVLDQLNSGKTFRDILPVKKDAARLTTADIIREPAYGGPVDEKLAAMYSSELADMAKQRDADRLIEAGCMVPEPKASSAPEIATLDFDEDGKPVVSKKKRGRPKKRITTRPMPDFADSDERPVSPGQQYDRLYVPAEIGVKRPRFSAEVHGKMLETQNVSKLDMQKFISNALDVETELKRQYETFADVRTIEKNMIRMNRKTTDRKRF